jgi:hypothetical protein
MENYKDILATEDSINISNEIKILDNELKILNIGITDENKEYELSSIELDIPAEKKVIFIDYRCNEIVEIPKEDAFRLSKQLGPIYHKMSDFVNDRYNEILEIPKEDVIILSKQLGFIYDKLKTLLKDKLKLQNVEIRQLRGKISNKASDYYINDAQAYLKETNERVCTARETYMLTGITYEEIRPICCTAEFYPSSMCDWPCEDCEHNNE